MPGRSLVNLFALALLAPLVAALFVLAGCSVTGSVYVEHKHGPDTTAGSSVQWTLSPRKE